MHNNPLITILLPAYNEELIIVNNTNIIVSYLISLEAKYNWEILIVNDGSKDNTGILADGLASRNSKIRTVHHIVNKNLGHALRTGFENAKGVCIIVLDLDLSYSVDHIERLADTLFKQSADVVIASPYMPGGKSTAVPFKRIMLSKVVNKLMSWAAQDKYYTFTGMVRAYKTSYIKSVNLKTKDYEINPEIIYKSMILRARVVEIPAHLDWTAQNKQKKRSSSINITKGLFSGLMSAFIFRPYIYFLIFGFILFILSMYIIGWIFYNTFSIIPEIHIEQRFFDDKFSIALARVFQERPHAFFVGGFTFVVSVVMSGLGMISLQNKRYFEELFHLNTNVLQKIISSKDSK